MPKLTKDNWITLAVAGVMVVACTLLWYLPQSQRLKQVQASIVAQRDEMQHNSEKAAIVPDLLRHIQEMRERYQGFDRRMPQRKELAGFLREISGILASEELSNQLTEPGNPSREKLYHTLPIIMKFQGGYLSLASLLERIDDMERLTRVQKLLISSSDDAKGELDIELQMNIYFTES